MSLDILAEGLVELDLAGGNQRVSEAHLGACRCECEPIAVQVVAVGDAEDDLQVAVIDSACLEAECLLWRQEFRGCSGAREHAGLESQQDGNEESQ